MILEGSVRIEGRTVRITVQLINAMNGYHVWSQSYDREAEKYLAMQKEVAVGVVNELNTVFLPLRSNPDLLTIN